MSEYSQKHNFDKVRQKTQTLLNQSQTEYTGMLKEVGVF
jgi:hypothetical protein